ncbi:tripartite motif-containing protein 16-like protein, partial [Limanda limanda]|uniref:tripartite motif-containing protein 16-like protein n=1 Tax=Limanda limanda TaxID=27771 RepID=UPI0029C6F3EF
LLRQPEIRAVFLKYSQEITMDPNTAHRRLLLSEGNRKVTCLREDQSYSNHPDRFTVWRQVLSRESLTGRCYWEVEVAEGVDVAVAYKNISRAGGSCESEFGYNDKSWSLYCSRNSYTFYYNSIRTRVSGRLPSRIGVYLDHSAGVLSFYRVSDTMTLLHRIQTTFTQPLYAGVWVYTGSTAEFSLTAAVHGLSFSLLRSRLKPNTGTRSHLPGMAHMPNAIPMPQSHKTQVAEEVGIEGKPVATRR